jgi:lipopolysaccharide exporter
MRKNKPFSQDALTLTIAPMMSQILGILLTPILTRMYSPDAFGLAALFGSIVMIPSVFATMGYNGAIILPKSNATANNLVLVCFFSIICVCGLSCLIIITGQDAIPLLLNAPLISDYLWLVPIYVVLHGMFMTLRFWKIRFHHFENITVSRIAEILGKKAYQISSGSFGLATAGGLIYGEFISTILKVLILLKGFRLKPFGFTRRIYLKLLAAAILYKKFPQYNVWTDLFSRLPALIITYFIIKYFGEGVLGFYGLTLMVLSLPSALFISSVLEAFIPRAAMAKHENKHTELLERLSTRLISIAIFPCLILGIFGDRLFPFVFGSEWLQAGLIAQVLIFKVFFEIITSPSLSLVDIMNKQELNFIRGIMSCLIALAAWLIASYYHDFYLALWTVVILEVATILLLSAYMMHLVKFSFLSSIQELLKYLFLCIIIGSSLTLIKLFLDLNIITLLSLIGISVLVYYAFLLYFDKELYKILKSIFPKRTKKKLIT